MFFLSTAFYIAKADLGDKLRQVASNILGGEKMDAVKEKGTWRAKSAPHWPTLAPRASPSSVPTPWRRA